MSLNFRARIRLREHDDADQQAQIDRGGLSRLATLPDGAEVVVDLGTRWLIDQRIAQQIRDNSDRLRIIVEGSPQSVESWHRFIVTGSTS